MSVVVVGADVGGGCKAGDGGGVEGCGGDAWWQWSCVRGWEVDKQVLPQMEAEGDGDCGDGADDGGVCGADVDGGGRAGDGGGDRAAAAADVRCDGGTCDVGGGGGADDDDDGTGDEGSSDGNGGGGCV